LKKYLFIGIFKKNRLGGVISVTRAIGDLVLQEDVNSYLILLDLIYILNKK
jgi:hypothetical protein